MTVDPIVNLIGQNVLIGLARQTANQIVGQILGLILDQIGTRTEHLAVLSPAIKIAKQDEMQVLPSKLHQKTIATLTSMTNRTQTSPPQTQHRTKLALMPLAGAHL
jgi:hypothetical protein